MTTTACKQTTKSGKQCQAAPLRDSDYCYQHDPHMAKERASARSRGGKARHGRTVHPPQVIDQVRELTAGSIADAILVAINDCLLMESSGTRAKTLATVCATAVKIIEVTELAEQLASLQQRLDGIERHE